MDALEKLEPELAATIRLLIDADKRSRQRRMPMSDAKIDAEDPSWRLVQLAFHLADWAGAPVDVGRVAVLLVSDAKAATRGDTVEARFATLVRRVAPIVDTAVAEPRGKDLLASESD